MLCVRCGREIPDGSSFCNYCGKRQMNAPPRSSRRTRRPNGTGSVYKLKGSRAKPWVAWNKKVIGTFASSSEATLALDDYNKHNMPVDVYTYTLGDVYNLFLKSDEYQKLTEKGREGLKVAWGRFLPLADRPARVLGTEDFQAIIRSAMRIPQYKTLTAAEYKALPPSKQKRYDALKTTPLEPLGYDAKARMKQLVVHLYRVMIRLKLVDTNYGELIVLPRAVKSSKRNFTEEEQGILRANDVDATVKMILIMVDMGLRIGELLTIPKSRVDLDGGVITWGSKTEAGKDRPIPIPVNTREYVEYFYAQGNPDGLLIVREGKKVSEDYFRKKLFYPTLERLGIKYKEGGRNVLTPHRARHTFIADAVKSGVAPEALKTVAGHSKYSTTIDKYNDDVDVEYLKTELAKKTV